MGGEAIRGLIKGGGRLVSPSVRAAEKLPPTIKKESVKNQLLRGGAKPLELEYAGLEDWVRQQEGSLSNEQVRDFLEQRGPLGRLQRLDQAGKSPAPGFVDDESEYRGEIVDEEVAEDKFNEAEYQYDQANEDAQKFMVKPDPRADVYERDADRMPAQDVTRPAKENLHTWPHTLYASYTESPAHGWDDAMYRELMWLDPETNNPNRPIRGEAFDPMAAPRPHSPHNTDMWVRYHLTRDFSKPAGRVIDVQNIQSDLGQDLALRDNYKRRRDRLSEKDAELWDGYRMRADDAEMRREDAVRQLRTFLEHYKNQIFSLGSSIAQEQISDQSLKSLIGAMAMDPHPGLLGKKVLQQLPLLVDHDGSGGFSRRLREMLLERDAAGRQYGAAASHARRFESDLRHRGILPPSEYHEHRLRDNLRGVQPSVLMQNDNWMIMPLRQLALESAVRGGAGIRLPLGVNVRAVEGMPRGAATNKYQNAFVRRLQSIYKPIGGSDVVVVPGTQKLQYEAPDEYGDTDTRTILVGPDGERAGTTVIPRKQAVDHINKHGLDLMALLLMAGAGTGAAMNSSASPSGREMR